MVEECGNNSHQVVVGNVPNKVKYTLRSLKEGVKRKMGVYRDMRLGQPPYTKGRESLKVFE